MFLIAGLITPDLEQGEGNLNQSPYVSLYKTDLIEIGLYSHK
jgi:hypothetical protein